MPLQQEIRWLLQEKYAGKETVHAKEDIARLEKGEHVDYVIGWVKFLGCAIDLRYKPLIPRPETEYWTEEVIEEMLWPRLRRPRILDLFAGSGCIGIAILKHVPGARVDFAEKEQAFCKQIEINAQMSGIDKRRYRVLQSDIFSGAQGKYDYILANPPYVAEEKKSRVQKSVLEQEPYRAVFAGEDGLRYIRPFLKEAKNYLRAGGVVYMEFDSPQQSEIAALLKKERYNRWDFFKDQYNKWRYLTLAR